MSDPNSYAKLLQAAALRVMESVTDFGPLMEWAALHEETLLKDLISTDPQAHGRLASMQGAIAELAKWKDLERWVRQRADLKPE